MFNMKANYALVHPFYLWQWQWDSPLLAGRLGLLLGEELT